MEIRRRILGQIVASTSVIFLLSGALAMTTREPLLGSSVISSSPGPNSTSKEPSSLRPRMPVTTEEPLSGGNVTSTNPEDNSTSSLQPGMHLEDQSNETLSSEAPDTKPTARSLRSTLERILIFTGIPEDYEDFDDETEAPFHPPTFAPSKPCDYDRCRHLQVPCEQMQRQQRCLCPGISGPAERPDPPRIQDIHVSENAVRVHWCAPLSTVSEYHVLYWRGGEQDIRRSPALNGTFRLVTLSDLEPATSYMVCVEASNSAGTSLLNEEDELYGPCKAIRTQGHQLPYLYVALAIAAALILLVLATLGWYFWARKKKSILRGSVPNIADAAGVPNPFYRSESVEQL
ncbi:LRRN4 C-terminal-like protein [Microcaecilia unicolor]|uniref:LRRN4 C-terminal-like protein n=1 Tax=Microcaecilia unicolor TaxID=1415580 RepID=A0A6P7ZNI7_9AMPH|nr:LRRN4 C-terminal-like protein [Microcaecilia unicolor]XP_030075980.1 LRRN4 C-terminal-like protein [Microcaecilia unicolor]